MVKNNNIRHFYAVKVADVGTDHLSLKTTTGEGDEQTTVDTPIGTVSCISNANDGTFYFEQINTVNGITRTDIVDASKIVNIRHTKASAMKNWYKRQKIQIDTLEKGGDYTIDCAIEGFMSLSPENFYNIHANAHCDSTDTLGNIMAKLLVSFATNAKSQEIVKCYACPTIGVESGNDTASSGTEITGSMKYSKSQNGIVDATGSVVVSATSIKSIVIEAMAQPWKRGLKPYRAVNFNCTTCSVLDSNSDEVMAGTVYAMKPITYENNSKSIADLEWFLNGNRGDIYRGAGYPNNYDVNYMVDEFSEGWDTIDIEFYWNGVTTDVQKSLKCMTFAAPESIGLGGLKTAIENAIKALTGKSSYTIPTVE